MRLSKYLAKTGVASRKESTALIKSGRITVNGIIEKNPTYEVQRDDIIKKGETVLLAKTNLQYILLNKQKNTTTRPESSVSVDDLFQKLNINILNGKSIFQMREIELGLTVVTNDLDLIEKLSAKNTRIKKTYLVYFELDLTEKNIDQIQLQLAGALIKSVNENTLEITLYHGSHIEIIETIEQIGIAVLKVDCIYFAGLTKKDLPRGWHRELTDMEVTRLKFFNVL